VVWGDRIIGAALLLACIPLWQIAGTFPELGGAFPRTVVPTIAGLCVLLLARSFVGASTRTASGEGRRELRALILPLIVAGAMALSIVAMTQVGFFPAMAGLSAALFVLLAGQRRLVYVVAVLCALAFIYAVFVLVLGVPLEASRILSQ
jgi:hypothetical protein